MKSARVVTTVPVLLCCGIICLAAAPPLPPPVPADFIEKARQTHWAFQSVRQPVVPPVTDGLWAVSPIDSFILNTLATNKLGPSNPADRRTLIRRAYFDLIGVPPAVEEIAIFEADADANAFAKVVDRLLASPHYGERWGRYWLDIARYADTKGYLPGDVEQRYPFAYTYRDYVIQGFNEDLPYDQFILQQIAADQVAVPDKSVRPTEDRRTLAAMGFLTLGRRFLNNPHDIIDDRIDVVTRGLMGLTVSCARCHDHKYDPVPTQDYYSLHGVFAASVEPSELPLIADPEQTEAYRQFEKDLKAREQEIAELREKKHRELRERLQGQVADYLLASRQKLRSEEFGQSVAPGELSPVMIRRWQNYLRKASETHHPVLAVWHALAALPQQEFTAKAAEIVGRMAGGTGSIGSQPVQLNPLVIKAFSGKPPTSLQEVARRYGDLLAEAIKTASPNAEQEAIRKALSEPLNLSTNELDRLLDRPTRDRLRSLQRRADQFKLSSASPPRAMILRDSTVLTNPHVLVRGNPANSGEEVPRRFLRVLAGPNAQPFKQGSGRLELARAIADKTNPLTARVMVNRIWLHHFGAGLVRTPSDFGTRGEPPTHPALLDYLAWRFMEGGWSIKKVHRLIMLSSTYQQSSEDNDAAVRIDPENRLLWKMNRRRLDWESLRDSLLRLAGNIDLTIGGRSVNIATRPFSTRRTVYGFIDRQDLPAVFRTFDFANPDATSPQRYETTVPQQALFLLNSPFVAEQVKQLVENQRFKDLQRPEERIAYLYQKILSRNADAEEIALGRQFIEAHKGESAWEKYVHTLLMSNEFAFVD